MDLLISDLHFGARGDSEIFNQHFLEFFEKQFFPYVETHNIENIIILGDVFDKRKTINFKILADIRKRFFSRLNNYKTILLRGNHDIYHKNTNELCGLEEIASEYSNILFANQIDYTLHNGKVLLVDWISPENKEETLEKIKNSKAEYCLGHFELVGFDIGMGNISTSGLDHSLFKHFKKVYSGHYHGKSEKDNICYLGTPYKITWADAFNHNGFYTVDFNTGEETFIENKRTLYHVIQYSPDFKFEEEYLKNCYYKVLKPYGTDEKEFQKFLKKLYEFEPSDVNIIEPEMKVENSAISSAKTTTEIISDYVNQFDYDENKKKEIINILYELYKESEQLEL